MSRAADGELLLVGYDLAGTGILRSLDAAGDATRWKLELPGSQPGAGPARKLRAVEEADPPCTY